MNKRLLKWLPYEVACIAGVGFFTLGLYLVGDVKNLLMSIAASLIAIPVILVCYDIIKEFSDRRLTQEIFEYGKMQVDREVMGIINQLMKIAYPLEKVEFTFKGINTFLSLSKEEIRTILGSNEYFGFQVLRSWDVYEANIQDVLKNSFIIQKLDNNQVIAIIQLLKRILSLDEAQKIPGLFNATGKKKTEYKLVKGDTINPANSKFPDRYLLLKHLAGDNFLVVDFPDIPRYNEEKAFYTYTLNPDGLEYYTDAIFDLLAELQEWVSLTGGEFLIDTKMFRLGYRTTQE